jgi:hypothetical protein
MKTDPAKAASALTETIGVCTSEVLTDLVQETAERYALYFDSLLEVGCGGRPLESWFSRYARTECPARYVAVDADPKVLDKLQASRVMAFPGLKLPFDATSDLVVAANVIECIKPDRAKRFVEECAAATGKMFALSTVNAEGWNRAGVASDHRGLGWVPESIVQCYRDADDPNRTRHLLNAGMIAKLFESVFPDPDWIVDIRRTGAVEITDIARGKSWRMYSKVLAVAVRRSACRG